MPLNPEHELSAASVQVLQLLVGGPSPALAEIDDAALTAFAAWMSSQEDHDLVVACLIRDSQLRQRFLTIKRGLETGDFEHSDAITGAAKTAFTIYSSLKSYFRQSAWASLISAQEPDAVSARATLAAIGRSLASASSSPQFSLVRGPETEFLYNGNVPVGVDIRLFAQILENGTLHVEAVFDEQIAGAAAPLVGRRFSLDLIDPSGGFLPIGEAVSSASGWVLEAEKFGTLTGLPIGSLPPSTFQLNIEHGPVLQRSRNHLFVTAGDGVSVPFEILEDPRISGEHLTVTLGGSEHLRRQYHNYQLELRVPVGSVSIKIGAWAMADWVEDVRTFRAALPGIADGRLECGSLLQGMLVANA